MKEIKVIEESCYQFYIQVNDVNEHFTTQYYLMENPPTDEEGIANSRQQFDLLEEIVGKEDYNMGKNQVKS